MWIKRAFTAVKRTFTAVHLTIGELLGLTHYRNCWQCVHADDVLGVRTICSCGYVARICGTGVAITDPCEAVWCDNFEGRGLYKYDN